ncbi:MAG: SOS response-associated peptidase family protein [Verrucomicrobiales bacterium]|nr:SOS response-associated peptidase family protein [Verrucomicrobiales bacterium]
MCNLYDIGRALRHRSRNDWEEAVAEALRDSQKNFGIRKTDSGLIVALKGGAAKATAMRWGFERAFNPSINNARSEKLDGMWSHAWQTRQRCLIPIATFYEWTGATGNKQTYAFEPGKDENFLWAAGLWESAPSSASFEDSCYTMLTTQAKGSIRKIHDRMPALLKADQFLEFLEGADPRSLLSSGDGNLDSFRCENPLKSADRHEGPVKQAMLPGFD